MHKTVSLDLETIPDFEACKRAGVDPADGFLPYPLHEIACASVLTIIKDREGKLSFSLDSFTRERMGERGIVASVERMIEDAREVVTFNGAGFDVPAMIVRAALTGEVVPGLARLHSSSAHVQRRHVDLAREIRGRGNAPAVKLVELCAPFSIPVKLDCAGSDVAAMAEAGEWTRIARYCESDVVATWLALQYWRGAEFGVPTLGEEGWTALADWIAEDPDRWPHLDPYLDVPELGGGRALGELSFEELGL